MKNKNKNDLLYFEGFFINVLLKL